MLRFSVLARTVVRPSAAPRTIANRLNVSSPITPISRGALRFYSPQSLDADAKLVNFQEVKDHVKNGDVTLVDVREPEEYKRGYIPGAINIPFRSSPGALGLPDAEFRDTFGFDKPRKDSHIVFYCQGGVRSSGAEQLAATYGYQNRENYQGSFGDWTANNGSVEVPSQTEAETKA